MSRLHALIFDVDGTLAETEELHRLSFNQSFQAAGLPWVWDVPLYGELLQVTGGKERIRFYQSRYGSSITLSEAEVAALHDEKTTRYTQAVSGNRLALRPGIKRLLQQALSRGIRLAVATTTSRPNILALLTASLGSQPFEVIAAGDEVSAKKPAPDIYLLALARLGLAPGQCLAIEDTPNGLQSAAAAGLACVITLSSYGGNGPFAGALAVLDHLGDPGHPATVVAGPALAGSMVELADLDAWVSSAPASS